MWLNPNHPSMAHLVDAAIPNVVANAIANCGSTSY